MSKSAERSCRGLLELKSCTLFAWELRLFLSEDQIPPDNLHQPVPVSRFTIWAIPSSVISRLGNPFCPRCLAALRTFALRPAHGADNAPAGLSCSHARRGTPRDKNWSENRGPDRGLHDIPASRNGGAGSCRNGEHLHIAPDTSVYRRTDLAGIRGNILPRDNV